ncbi:hypothetical protein SAMN05192529_11531 [Arachidicoccus rhizosphaerae]|uniref:Uncharacterized protein n=1 Tax=Arachidicoccus rhizosphaerae TaxID=551991 RepID=A0A1H4AK62_9BACT|nr:hypothetical protein SAMN05192529_11531 [Arachidicoccus rhizosphaerae]
MAFPSQKSQFLPVLVDQRLIALIGYFSKCHSEMFIAEKL